MFALISFGFLYPPPIALWLRGGTTVSVNLYSSPAAGGAGAGGGGGGICIFWSAIACSYGLLARLMLDLRECPEGMDGRTVS
jgi:hypothetical protein